MFWIAFEDYVTIRFTHAWNVNDMAHGIESLVSLNPFFPMNSSLAGHSDNCKFWLLDLGRCFHMCVHLHAASL